MPILAPVPNIFLPNTVIRSSLVNANFASIVAGVNSGAAASGINSDITQLNALTNFTSTNGTVTGTLTINILNVTGLATFSSNIVMLGTGALQLASGSTAQRPGSPVAGDIRYNTTTSSFEGYGGVSPAWSAFGSVTGFPLSLGLRVTNNGVVPDTKIDVTASLAQIITSTNVGISRNSVSVTIDSTVVGPNGIDVGSLAASTWYYVWLIDNGSVTAGLLSLSSTAPNLPVGYLFKSRVGAVRTDGAVHFFRVLQVGARASFVITPATTTSSHPVLTTVTVTGTATSFPVAPGAPPTAPRIIAILGSSFTTIQTNVNTASGVISGNGVISTDILLESSNLYYFNTTSPSGDIRSAGWVDSVAAF